MYRGEVGNLQFCGFAPSVVEYQSAKTTPSAVVVGAIGAASECVRASVTSASRRVGDQGRERVGVRCAGFGGDEESVDVDDAAVGIFSSAGDCGAAGPFGFSALS
jgi:hypothetical protein